MRYNVHQSRYKIGGVLAVAALVATLGLPSTAQAQTIAADGVEFSDNDPNAGLTVTWSTRLNTNGAGAVDNWIVTFTRPNGMQVVLNTVTTPAATPPLGEGGTTMATLNQKDLGTWWVQVDACFMPLGTTGATKGVCPRGELESGTSVGYTHGAWEAPEALTASMVPGGVALTWTAVKGDRGFAGYEYSENVGDVGEKWTAADSSGAMVLQRDPGEYTFWVRARGASDNDLNTDEGEPAAGKEAATAESVGAAASVDITVPMPAPTLPEIALLLLAMLLLGSGAYLLRRRQSGGLTPA